jgi:tetratricopeptide (TPR) repeat protein
MKNFAFTLTLVFGLASIPLDAREIPGFKDYFESTSRSGTSLSVQSKRLGRFVVSWVDPRDEVIADALLAYVQAADRELSPLWALASTEKDVPIEIFPDLKSFADVSGLPLVRFRATGTIALTLDQRLMLLSPRNLASGYPWAVTVVHEYIHYLIREISLDHIPIWLHEGTAQVFQGYPYDKEAKLQPSQWGLFKKKRSQNQLLDLPTLREPFPYRKDPEEAALAYIQSLLFVNWLNDQCGVIPLIRKAEEMKNIDKALQWCTKKSMAQLNAIFIPEIMAGVKIPEGSDVEFFARDFSGKDPLEVESQKMDKEAKNFAVLSDRLFDQGRFQAAVVEMQKAMSRTPVAPPSWQRQLALSLQQSQQTQAADNVLRQLLEQYPDDAAAWWLKAQGEKSAGRLSKAWQALLRAFYINPFLDGLLELKQQIRQKDSTFTYSLENLE